ncbi:uncharacterized protein LOC143882217 isoform X2 [Tasmannia lanceolata]|uniref:uncharacterized protein LOC143882217 isoform X2 n=1 Tax=Tasmannia lanceolata TaxID=3420 RepID=UPI004063725A
MFKAARWRSEKNKIKAVFKLQLKATQVPQLGWDTLMVSLIPLDVGKPTVKSEKATVHDGTCRWENPIYETVRFIQEPKAGKINEKIYQFLVLTGSSKAGLLGEVTVDFAEYAESIKPSSVSLPLKTSNSSAILHVTIQRIQTAVDGREVEENGDVTVRSHGRTLQSQLKNYDTDGNCKVSNGTNNGNSIEDGSSIAGKSQLSLSHKTISQNADSNGILRASSYGDAISASSLDSSSGQDTPKENRPKNNKAHQDFAKSTANPDRSVAHFRGHRSSNTEWLVSPGPEGSIDGSTNSSEDSILKERSQASDTSVENLKNEVIVLARQAEVSELELQTLKKQIVKESRRGQDLSREVCILKEERDALRRECEQFKASQKNFDRAKVSNKLQFEEDSRFLLEELRQELSYEKDLNANLRLQLQKTQKSNSELILAVRDLEDLLEQKNKEASNNCCSPIAVGSETNENGREIKFAIGGSHLSRTKSNQEVWEALSKHEIEDEEQHALEVLVKDHDDADGEYPLEQKIFDLCHEIEEYKKDREELEMQMEQLALDYEILKQENHDMSSKLEQSRLQEQLKIQYECSASFAMINELETHIEYLEKELEEQSEVFKADLETIACAKVEQEKRAIRAEEALRKIKWNNSNTVERLQEEFKRLSMQMQSTFDANEKAAMQALTEAKELRMQKSNIEDLLEKANEELGLMKDRYEVKLEQIDLKTKEKDQLILELEDKSKELESLKTSKEEMNKALSNEILLLQNEIKKLTKEKTELSEHVEDKEKLRADMERGNMERDALERKITSLSNKAKKSMKELDEMRCLKDEKETMVGILQSEMATLRSQYNDLKHSLSEDEIEKENLRKQVFHLKDNLQKKEDSISIIEKKLKDSSIGVPVSDETTKPTIRNQKSVPPPRGSKDIANLREKIKLLEVEIKHKEAALENSTHMFLKKEKDMCNRIQELEKEIVELNQNDPSVTEDKLQKDNLLDRPTGVIPNEEKKFSAMFEQEGAAHTQDANVENRNVNSIKSKDTANVNENILESDMGTKADILDQNGIDRVSIRSPTGTNSETEQKITTGHTIDQGDRAELSSEMTILKERNKSMESELKEMQERYSQISLKFAEVEGERQKLVMTIRNLKNSKKN